MPLLFSNYPPIRTGHDTYASVFQKLLEKSDSVKIATGYISADSVVDLRNIVEANGGPSLELCIGMHYFEGVTAAQKFALAELASFLSEKKLGNVYMVVTFPFHGKLVNFQKKSEALGSILGSSNLSNIIQGTRQYEADYLFEDQETNAKIEGFISDLIEKASKPINSLELRVVREPNTLLLDQYGVEKLSDEETEAAKAELTDTSFDIPLKASAAPKSNLNTHFGKGRDNMRGFVLPRSWYEVELIVPKEITAQPGYPQADPKGEGGIIDIVTDDGWEFKCKVSGDYSKNLRSEGDLKVLGKWLKGRLENAGVLNPGEFASDETLQKYGRDNLTLTQMKDGRFYLDFGVEQ